jgi:hypothetical protein
MLVVGSVGVHRQMLSFNITTSILSRTKLAP